MQLSADNTRRDLKIQCPYLIIPRFDNVRLKLAPSCDCECGCTAMIGCCEHATCAGSRLVSSLDSDSSHLTHHLTVTHVHLPLSGHFLSTMSRSNDPGHYFQTTYDTPIRPGVLS